MADTLDYVIFHGIFEICGGGEGGLSTTKMHFGLMFICKKECTSYYVFIYKMFDTSGHILNRKKYTLCVTFL